MSFSQSDYFLAFHYCSGIGAKTFKDILKVFGNAQTAWNSSITTWKDKGFTKNVVSKYSKHRQEFDIIKAKNNLKKLNIKYITQKDFVYPQLLLQISDPPIGLFLKGEIKAIDNLAIAVVGTRRITNYGKEITQRITSGLAGNGVTIVSGLAKGVDGIAHRSTLGVGGRTIAVLGCGVDIIYPSEHKALANSIIKNGAIISEYPPGTIPHPGHFPARNRIISGMSLGVVVTEGASRSGSKITALMALEQNREVFAIPGPITNKMSNAPAELIQAGAKLVLSEKDILEELNLQFLKSNYQSNKKQIVFNTKLEEKIWKYLSSGHKHIDSIVRKVSIDLSDVNATLSMMEIDGLVKNLGDGVWMIN